MCVYWDDFELARMDSDRLRELTLERDELERDLRRLEQENDDLRAELRKYKDFQRTESYLRGQLAKQAAALDAFSRKSIEAQAIAQRAVTTNRWNPPARDKSAGGRSAL